MKSERKKQILYINTYIRHLDMVLVNLLQGSSIDTDYINTYIWHLDMVSVNLLKEAA